MRRLRLTCLRYYTSIRNCCTALKLPQKFLNWHCLERVGELIKVESRANFVVTKRQSDDQTVATTDRPSMGRNRSGDPVRLSSILNASESTIYGRLSTAFFGSCERVANGGTCPIDGHTGKQFITTSTFGKQTTCLNELMQHSTKWTVNGWAECPHHR